MWLEPSETVKQMTAQKVVFISACVSIFVSLLSAFLNHYLTKRRDRKRKLWELDVERVNKLMELAETMYDELRYNTTPTDIQKNIVLPLLEQFEQNARFERKGQFLLTYRGLDEAIWEFPNAVHYFLDNKVDSEDNKSFERTIEQLRSACNLVIKGKGKL